MTANASLEAHPAQRRTVTTLAGGQVLGGVGVSAGLAVGSLLAAEVAGSERWAGLSGTFTVLGGAVFAALLARVMAERGRRPGLVLGYLLAIGGTLLVLLAAAVGSFTLLLVGSLFYGGATASNSQARFAATDLASPSHRGRDLSIVVWATTIGAVAGPNLTGPAASVARAVGLGDLTGPYLFALVGFCGAALLLTLRLRPDPLIEATRALAAATTATAPTAQPARRRGLRAGAAAVRAHPAALTGMVTVASGHAVMVAVMVMTPLHMSHGHAGLQVIGLTISLHIAGMYALSPLVGWSVDRVGGRAVALAGVATLTAACLLAAMAPSGSSTGLTLALILLGLGWSGTMIAGSTMLTAALPPPERPAAQGLLDLVMGLAGGAAGALAGIVVHAIGYPSLAVASAVIAGLTAVALLASRE